MTPLEISDYLHRHIPLSRALELEVHEASDDRTLLSAPLAPNLNHRQSAFGGSMATLAILSAWTWLHRFTRSRNLQPTLVIQEEKTRFLAPALNRFTAICPAPPEPELERFLTSLKRYHRARIRLQSVLRSEGIVVARFDGLFVALD